MRRTLNILLALSLLLGSPWPQAGSDDPLRLQAGRDLADGALAALVELAGERGWTVVRLGRGVYLQLTRRSQRSEALEQLARWREAERGLKVGGDARPRADLPALSRTGSREGQLELLLRSTRIRTALQRTADAALNAAKGPLSGQLDLGRRAEIPPSAHLGTFIPGAASLRGPPAV